MSTEERRKQIMKLNPECIRDILFLTEETTSLSTGLRIEPNSLPKPLEKYSSDEVIYHVKQCELSGLFSKVDWFLSGSCIIYYLSPSGHQFISDIRSDNAWSKTKEIAKSIGANSIDTIKQIATSVITTLIQNQLGLH